MTNKIIIGFALLLLCFSSRSQSVDTSVCQLKINKINDSSYATGRYEKMQKQGVWVFYKCGIVIKIVNYHNDTLSGKGYYFNASGVLIREANLKSGKLNGLVKFYANDGELIAIYEYTNSIKGLTKYYKVHPERPPKGHNYRPEY